jgi:hypothetical protein
MKMEMVGNIFRILIRKLEPLMLKKSFVLFHMNITFVLLQNLFNCGLCFVLPK